MEADGHEVNVTVRPISVRQKMLLSVYNKVRYYTISLWLIPSVIPTDGVVVGARGVSSWAGAGVSSAVFMSRRIPPWAPVRCPILLHKLVDAHGFVEGADSGCAGVDRRELF